MKKVIKALLLIVIGTVGLLALLLGVMTYLRDSKKTKIAVLASPDGRYEVKLTQIGEPQFPFGEVRCRLTLKEGRKKLAETELSFANDGKNPDAEQFAAQWQEDGCLLTVSGEEENAAVFLAFDGSTERR